MSGSKLDRQKAADEADSFVRGDKGTPTQDSDLNTGEQENNVQHENNDGTPAPVQATDSKDLREQLRISEAKYDVLQGKYKAELPRLNDEISSLRNQVNAKSDNGDTSALTKRISELESQLSSKGQEQVSSDKEVSDYIASEYGDDLANAILGMIKKNATPSSGEEVGQLRQQVEDMQRSSSQASRDMRITSLTQMLKARSIDFQKTDGDPLFHDWLAQNHPGTGNSRQDFLAQHFNNGNVEAAAQFYSDFKAQERSSYTENPLAKHVDVSGQTGSGDNDAQPDVWTGDDVTKLYSDQRKGKFTREEFEKKEQSLNRAMQNGDLKP